ncbi:hypothetical protein DAEQUDRAFT_725413 [Daedalea quercina L-15889]|uniref:Uncharacterized protein n=1 Tax=Daedalea quercina L-15889 TaxID=1314783 RepID=A0A165R9T0_9APHY|nr:hypothetical protein DAEQUDRAFT_725413 [Daedalea quercina L-15889]
MDPTKIDPENGDAFGFSDLTIHEDFAETHAGALIPASWPPSERYDASHEPPTVVSSFMEPSEYVPRRHADPIAHTIYPHSEPGPSIHYAQHQDHSLDHRAQAVYYGEIPPFEPPMYPFPQDGDVAAFSSQFLQPPFVSPSVVHSRMTRPLASNYYIACAWGSQCSVLLDDLTPAGIARHLKEYHFRDPSKPWHPRNRGTCQWRDMDGVCRKELNYASFGKHVAAVHLQSTARACPHCFQNLGRADSLERHIKNYCPRSGRCEKK